MDGVGRSGPPGVSIPETTAQAAAGVRGGATPWPGTRRGSLPRPDPGVALACFSPPVASETAERLPANETATTPARAARAAGRKSSGADPPRVHHDGAQGVALPQAVGGGGRVHELHAGHLAGGDLAKGVQ